MLNLFQHPCAVIRTTSDAPVVGGRAWMRKQVQGDPRYWFAADKRKRAAEPCSAAQSLSEVESLRSLHVARHVGERGLQLVAQALHRGNCGDGDERGDQAVLDGGGTL